MGAPRRAVLLRVMDAGGGSVAVVVVVVDAGDMVGLVGGAAAVVVCVRCCLQLRGITEMLPRLNDP